MNLIRHLPYTLAAVPEYAALCETVDEELTLLREQIEAVRRELVISTAREAGLSAWEEVLALSGDGSVSDRRAAILSRTGLSRPYTVSALHERLSALVGESGYTLDVDGRTVTVTVSLEAKGAFSAVCTMLRETLPANVAVEASVKLTRNAELTLRHADLSAYTHEMIRNEVAVNGTNDTL